MITTTWVISISIITFTKNKNADTGQADKLVFNRFWLYCSLVVI